MSELLWQAMLSRSFRPEQWFEEDDSPEVAERRQACVVPKGVLMWVYRPIENTGGTFYLVGYFTPDKVWVEDSQHKLRDDAARRVNWLNGGK